MQPSVEENICSLEDLSHKASKSTILQHYINYIVEMLLLYGNLCAGRRKASIAIVSIFLLILHKDGKIRIELSFFKGMSRILKIIASYSLRNVSYLCKYVFGSFTFSSNNIIKQLMLCVKFSFFFL